VDGSLVCQTSGARVQYVPPGSASRRGFSMIHHGDDRTVPATKVTLFGADFFLSTELPGALEKEARLSAMQ